MCKRSHLTANDRQEAQEAEPKGRLDEVEMAQFYAGQPLWPMLPPTWPNFTDASDLAAFA